MSVNIDDKNVFTKEMADLFETEVIECPDCGFEFSTKHHEDNEEGVYRCPCCHEAELIIVKSALKEKVERYEKALREISRVGYSKEDREMWFSPDSHLKCIKIAVNVLED